MKILCLNAGSATVKYRVFAGEALEPLARGEASRIGEDEGEIAHTGADGGSRRRRLPLADHEAAFHALLEDLEADATVSSAHGLAGVGHRVVHGGDRFTAPVRIDDAVLAAIRDLGRMAPLHNEASAIGIEIARSLLPGAAHVAVFDTAFHATLPAYARRYAIPDAYAARGFRRYGFHGISHESAAGEAARRLARPLEHVRLVTLHLGNGASAAAIRGGTSVDTSMGMTPLEGLVMGTRSGDLDPGVVLRLVDSAGLSPGDVETLLNRDSGLRALAGSADMRDLEARATAGDARAEEALAVFCYRVKKYIGAYVAALGGIDALVFTGGIGENSAGVRARSCAGLETLGIALDEAANRQHRREIHTGAVPVLVVRTDEEHAIARATLQVLRDGQTETCGDDPTFRHGR